LNSPFEKAIEYESIKEAVNFLENLKIPINYRRSAIKSSYAVLVAFCRNKQGDPCLLYTQRSQTMRTDRGMISFPGGLQDETDTGDHITTALRETHEEIGVDPSRVIAHGVGAHFATRNNFGVIYPVLGSMNLDWSSNQPFYLNKEEVEAVHLIPLKDLCNTSNWRYTRWKRPGASHCIALPVYRDSILNDKTAPRLWGITGIITHFVMSAILPNEYKFDFEILSHITHTQ
jgi:8-oxo-dGTP pyrophosphatase MutT (NUDIX family)